MGATNISITRADFLKGAASIGALALIAGPRAHGAEGRMRTRPIPKSREALPMVGLGTSRVFNVGGDAAVGRRGAKSSPSYSMPAVP